jgi:hypothetical protein
MRADAQRNRGLLLDAAGRVFIEVGMEAPLQLIARLRTNGRSIAQWSRLEPDGPTTSPLGPDRQLKGER